MTEMFKNAPKLIVACYFGLEKPFNLKSKVRTEKSLQKTACDRNTSLI